MKIYLINLSRRGDRLAEMDRQFAQLALAYERVSAIDGLTEKFRPNINTLIAYLWNGFAPPSRGAIGCYYSHREVWQRLLCSGDSQCFVFEDDVDMSHWDPTIESCQLADLDLDLLQLGWNRNKNLVTKKPLGSSKASIAGRVVAREPAAGACAYIISKDGARKCLAAGRYWFPVDDFDVWNEVYGLRTAALLPRICEPNGSESDIQFGRKRSGSALTRRLTHPLLRAWFRQFGPPRG